MRRNRVEIENWFLNEFIFQQVHRNVVIMQFNSVWFLSRTYLNSTMFPSPQEKKKRAERLNSLAMRLPEIEISKLSTRFIFRRFDAVEDKYWNEAVSRMRDGNWRKKREKGVWINVQTKCAKKGARDRPQIFPLKNTTS